MSEWVWRGYWGTTFADTAKQQAEAMDPSFVGAALPPRGEPSLTVFSTIKFFVIALREGVEPPALTGVTQNDTLVVSYFNALYGD
jgi:hypothetical protein